MLGEFLLRLAIALPLVCAAAALSILALRRGWLRLPGGLPLLPVGRGAAGEAAPLKLVAQQPLGASARLAVVRFDGRDHLLAISGQCISLLASTAGPRNGPDDRSEDNPCAA